MSKFWNFTNSQNSNDDVELRISGEIVNDDDAWLYEWFGITAASPNKFREELNQYKGKNITVWIDSDGGDVFAGAGIYDALKNHNGKVTTKITKAISAASVIAMAGDNAEMSPVGIMMIHNPLTSAKGDARVMRKTADVLDIVKDTIISAYANKANKSKDEIWAMMDDETWMSANVAIKEGFVDKVLYVENKGEPIENSFAFKHLNIQNSMAESMKKFFEVAKQTDSSAPQAQSSNPQPDANINNKQEGAKPMFKNIEELRNDCPDLVKQIEDTAKEDGRKEERTRIQNIEKISKNIASDLVNKAKYEEPMDAKELAFQAMQNDAAKGKKYLENAQKDSNDSGASNVPAAPASQNTEEEKLAAEDKAVESIVAGGNKRRGI